MNRDHDWSPVPGWYCVWVAVYAASTLAVVFGLGLGVGWLLWGVG